MECKPTKEDTTDTSHPEIDYQRQSDGTDSAQTKTAHEILYQWHINRLHTSTDEGPKGVLNSDQESNEWFQKACPKGSQDLESSPLCDFCTTTLDLLTRRESAQAGSDPADTGSTPPNMRMQKLSQFERSAREKSCHFCLLRWSVLSESEREQLSGSDLRVEMGYRYIGLAERKTKNYDANGNGSKSKLERILKVVHTSEQQ
ncbi:hypothetical protein BDD12DRAFT_877373 [Trichophaea hybrida]|nr:hypothetical protein BDD12DRAFT_877373 [Trichophaea hybrida]